MLALNHKRLVDGAHNEYDPMRPDTQKIDKRLQAHMSIGGISPRQTNAATIGRTLSQLRRAPLKAAGRLSSVKAMLPEDIERYSAYLAPFYESADAKKAAVLALHSIFTSIIDNAFAKSATDIILQERTLKESFQTSVSHASLAPTPSTITAKPGYEAASGKPKSKRGFEP